MLPSPTIPPDPFARSALPFRLACLLARGAPASDIMACGADCWGEARVQIALVDALATAKAWVGCGGHGGQPPLLLGPPGFEARLLGRVAAAAEESAASTGRAEDSDGDDNAGVQEGLAAALAAALLAGGPPATAATTTAWREAALVFGRPARPATLIRARLCSDFLAGDTGCTVWPAALALGVALASGRAPESVHNRHVLELGAGTGVLGCLLAAACAPASVTLTDGDEAALQNAGSTVVANGFKAVWVPAAGGLGGGLAGGATHSAEAPPRPLASISLARLAWTADPPPSLVPSPSPPPPGGLLVLGADVSYDPGSVGALAACVAALLRRGGPGSAALVAGVRRTEGSVAAFEGACKVAGLGVERWGVVVEEGGDDSDGVRCWGFGAQARKERVEGWWLRC